MALIEKPATPAAAAARNIRNHAAWLVRQTNVVLRDIRAEVAKVGRVALATELGSADAAELAGLYGKAKALLVAAGETVEDLPA